MAGWGRTTKEFYQRNCELLQLHHCFLFICVHGDGRIAKQGNGERGLSGAMDDSIPIAPTTQDPWRQCGAVIIFCLSLTEMDIQHAKTNN